MYADDIILFSKASNKNAANMVSILEKYCKWSGQMVNYSKSGVFFSKHTLPNTQRAIKSILQVKKLKKDVVYLGTPMFLLRAPSKSFSYLHEKLEAKLSGWRSKCLSWAGRETLINSVVQTIPNYTMSTFNVPTLVCDKLDSLARKFWWKPKERDGKFLAWKSWEKLCLPKGAGGLGFKKSKDINNALLAKLAWMIASNRESLCMTILRAKYKVKGDWLRSDPIKAASPIWRAIESTKSLVVKRACYLVGDGTSINIWTDPWVPWLQGFIPKPKSPALPNPPTKVSSLINHNLHCWKPHIINNVFETQSAQAILSIPIPITSKADKLCWTLESKGAFTVKSAYKASLSHLPTHSTPLVDWKKIWKLNAPQRIKMFLWRLGNNVLPTRENISHRLDIPITSCVLCKKELESLHHIFFKCDIVRALWFAVCWGFKAEHCPTTSPESIINLVLNPSLPSSQLQDQWVISLNIALTLEEIWRIRNDALFNKSTPDIQHSISIIQHRLKEASLVLGICSPSVPNPHPLPPTPSPLLVSSSSRLD